MDAHSTNVIIACLDAKTFSLHSLGIMVLEVHRAYSWIEYDNASVAKQNICLSHNTASCTRCTRGHNLAALAAHKKKAYREIT